MVLLSSLAFACILVGLMAGLVVFALLIVVVEHFTTGGVWPDRGRIAYVLADAFLVVSQRSAWRLVAVAASTGAVLFIVGLGLLVA